ncbi:hypothetical protein BC938DRAFT_483554 [Jimgerdemannia flammicorona]|uniref:WD40-repeat-containing domain protein n=1 Tax=Jimgerdemannia flammicorona TaxID=994334 RepID=A0A433QBU5_9FUNG|nr:hypothetical protein BC938DRAFT_483554 [Jimgerdemannia flammicorona]
MGYGGSPLRKEGTSLSGFGTPDESKRDLHLALCFCNVAICPPSSIPAARTSACTSTTHPTRSGCNWRRLSRGPPVGDRFTIFEKFWRGKFVHVHIGKKLIALHNPYAGRWTITDANLSPDNQWIIYSSITPVVYLAKTVPDDDVQTPLDFSSAMIGNAGLWSVRFSNDGREVVAGASVDVSRGVDRCILGTRA